MSNVREIIRGFEAELRRLEERCRSLRIAIRVLQRLDPAVRSLVSAEADRPRKRPSGPDFGQKVRAGIAAAKAKKAHGVPGKPGAVVNGKKAVVTCEGCGRDDVKKSTGPGGYMHFHFAPCGLVCAAVNLDKVQPEDKRDGIHARKNCPKCTPARRELHETSDSPF